MARNGALSPAATALMVIAEYIVAELDLPLDMQPRPES